MHRHLEEDSFLSQLLQLAAENKDISALWLYGSRVDQTATDNSDYDLAVAFRTFIKEPLARRLRPEELAIQWISRLRCVEDKVSIVDINIVPTTLAWEVVNKGVPVFIQDRDRVVREELRIFRQFELDVSYHRRIYGEKS
jgi:predicted nucleotidyltransferase